MTEPEPVSTEPGSPALARVMGVVVVLLVLAVAAIQQIKIATPAPEPEQKAGEIAPPDPQFELAARLAVKINQMGRDDPAFAGAADMAGGKETDDLRKQAESPADHLRVAIAVGELDNPTAGLKELAAAHDELVATPDLAADAAVVERLLTGGVATPDEQKALREHHGWFGELAPVVGLPDSDPARRAVVGGGIALLTVFGSFILLVGAAMLAGLVLFVIALVKIVDGSLLHRFHPLPPGGSALIETVAVFIVAFLLLGLVGALVEFFLHEDSIGVRLALQWSLLLVALWPVVRGMPRADAFRALGLYPGRGFFREVGAGVIGYLACLPLLLVGIGSMLALGWLQEKVREHFHMKPAGPPRNPVVEVLSEGGASGWLVLLVFLLATVWAPIMEEIVFRGALFGHLRKRWGVFVSALLVAPAFGLMHGYPLILLGGVMSLGFGFSLLREWRGSLIAPMVAHCLNNFAILTFVIVLVWALG
jgi:membrane protease YdiL (CAAX protease family)